jgi:hypothetical protein
MAPRDTGPPPENASAAPGQVGGTDRQILEIVENVHRNDLSKEDRDRHLQNSLYRERPAVAALVLQALLRYGGMVQP